MSPKIDITEKTFIEVDLLPGSELTNVQNLNITNFTVAFDESYTKMHMKIQFATPGLISIVPQTKDILELTIINLTHYVSDLGLYPITHKL